MKNICIAVVNFCSLIGKTINNLDRMAIWIKKAKRKDAAIICFPEMNITGYVLSKHAKELAEPVPGPITVNLLDLAASENIVILAGMLERDKDGHIFASHLVVKPDGVLGIYRKLHIAPPERTIFTPGNKIPQFETDGVKFGIQLCYDAHFPELSTHMAMQGADVIFIPHASPRGTPDEKFKSWMRHLPARAYDNSVFVIACNQSGKNENGLSFPGISLIIGPSGKIIEKDLSGKEGMTIGCLNASDLFRTRNHRMRFFLPNRRPELYGTLTK